jgi:dolichyl-phosphate beta-glucosyltransferase
MSDLVEDWINSQPDQKKGIELSLIIPAYNERWRLPPTLIDIIDYVEHRKLRYEIIVVDDGSTDETSDIVRKFERVRPNELRCIRLPKNRGKGHAVRTGAVNATGKRIIFLDADGATPIAEIERLEAALDGGADIAIGSRAMKSTDTQIKTVWYRKLLGRIFNSCVNFILLPEINDTQCGFKMFTAEAAAKLFPLQTAERFSFDVELLYLARKFHMKIAEVPINWENVPGSKVNLVLDSLRMLRDVIRFRVIHRNRS